MTGGLTRDGVMICIAMLTHIPSILGKLIEKVVCIGVALSSRLTNPKSTAVDKSGWILPLCAPFTWLH